MKKFLIALNFIIWATVAVEAQAAEVNVECPVVDFVSHQSNYKITFDPDTGRGAIGNLPITVSRGQTTYIINAGRGDVWTLDRQTLAIDIYSKFFNKSILGQCQVVQTNNKI